MNLQINFDILLKIVQNQIKFSHHFRMLPSFHSYPPHNLAGMRAQNDEDCWKSEMPHSIQLSFMKLHFIEIDSHGGLNAVCHNS